jgi:Bacterial tandem repeat domain 1
MAARNPPESWFWSHDIKADQIDSVLMPGMRLIRLSSYGAGKARRFAALVYKEPGPARSYALDLDEAALRAKLRDSGGRPVAITVDAGDGTEPPRFSLVLETGPGPLASVHLDLDDAGVRSLIDDDHGIADLATYVVGGVRKYAVIQEERPGTSWLFTGVTGHELDAKLLELGASLVRLRAYTTNGKPQLAAIAERALGTSWAWYTDLDADGVAKNLENNAAYPLDLDATRDERGVRFTVIMARQR